MRTICHSGIIVVVLVAASCSKSENIHPQNGRDNPPQTRAQGDGIYETLGFGYDITGEYLDFNSIKYPIVNVAAFAAQNPDRLHKAFIGKIETKIYGGDNYQSYIHEIQKESGISTSASWTGKQLDAIFAGSKSRSNKYEFSSKYSFAQVDVIKRHLKYEIDATPTILANYLTTSFSDDLKNLSAPDIVKKYGTHVILNIEVGGLYRAKYKSQVIREASTTIKKATAEAGITSVLKKIGISLNGSASTTETTNLEKKNIGWDFNLESYGGTNNGVSISISSDGGAPNTTLNIANWAASVDDTHSVLMNINWDKAYPIDNFVTDLNKKQAIKIAIKLYIASNQVNILEVVPLYEVNVTDATNDYNVYGDDGLNYVLNIAPYKNKRRYVGLVGYVLKEAINSDCLPLHSIDNTRTQNTYTVLGDSELNHYLKVLSGYQNRKYAGQTGFAHTTQYPGTEPMYRIDNSRARNTFSVVGEAAKNYYLYELKGYQNRKFDGQTGFIYPPSFK